VDPARRWFSTNTRTLDVPSTQSETAGMSYGGAKSTTFNGIECLPWGEVFSRCTKGFEEESVKKLNDFRLSRWDGFPRGEMSATLSHMSPDRLGLRSKMTPPGLFDSKTDATRGHNECRMPNMQGTGLGTNTNFLLPTRPMRLSGPLCMVNASDPRAINFTHASR
jgi:hypothetical protein